MVSLTEKSKNKKIHSTQELCPVADVTSEGIVIVKSTALSPTKYVRILKFTPINFDLLSEKDKNAKINTFAGLLRYLPPNCHIKIMSRRADTREQLRALRSDIESETKPQCRQLQIDQAQQIMEMGQYGVQTDFYLIYHYVHDGGGRPAYEEIAHYMDDQQTVIAGTLGRCGNILIQPKDKSKADIQLEYLYDVYSRAEAQDKPFSAKRAEILKKMIERNGLFLQNAVIAPADLLSPTIINDRFSASQILVDSLYYTFLYVPSRSIPDAVRGGWLSDFIAIAAGIDVDLFLEAIPASKIRQKLRIAQNVNESNWRRAATNNDPSQYELERLVQSGAQLQADMANGDRFFTFGLMITVTNPDRKQLERMVRKLTATFKARNIDLKPFLGRQKEAFLASLPLCDINKQIWKGMRRNALASDAASLYPFISSVISDPGGIPLGRNLTNGSLVFLNPFDTSIYTNANMTILGMAGAGKSVLLKSLALRSRISHVQTFIIAPEKGYEFDLPAQAVGGTLIRLGGGYGDTINIMDIRKVNFERRKEMFHVAHEASLMTQKCEQIQIFFAMLLPDMTSRESAVLDQAAIATYKEFGITADNKSLIDPRNPPNYRKMPILSDLYRNLKTIGTDADRLVEALGRFVTPNSPAAFFNAPTNVDLDNEFVVIDVSRIRDEKLTTIAMFVALDFLWSAIEDDPSRRKMVLIDEVWKLLGSDATPQCAKFVTKIFKLIRSMNGSAVAATQNLNGFFSRQDSASDVINNSQISFLLKTKSSEVDALRSAFGLTSIEAEQLTTFNPGEALMVASQVRAMISVELSKYEYFLMTTDPNDVSRRVTS